MDLYFKKVEQNEQNVQKNLEPLTNLPPVMGLDGEVLADVMSDDDDEEEQELIDSCLEQFQCSLASRKMEHKSSDMIRLKPKVQTVKGKGKKS